MEAVKFDYPVKNKKISYQFGQDSSKDMQRRDFYTLFDNKHSGVDFPVPVGTDIFASYPGIVVRKEYHKGMGNTLGIRNGNIIVIYAHLKEFLVDLGEKVHKGQLLAVSGNTGDACPEPHLHLETRDITKKTLNEMVFNPPFGEEITRWKSTFEYIINNDNTQKTLEFLSVRYFGKKSYWKKIYEVNTGLTRDINIVIPEGTKVIIPNY